MSRVRPHLEHVAEELMDNAGREKKGVRRQWVNLQVYGF